MMFAELLNTDQCRPLQELLRAYPHKPYNWALAGEQEGSLVDYVSHTISRTIESGGIAKAYTMGSEILGVCVMRPDEWAARELEERTFLLTHLIASGKPETQSLIKSMLLRDTLREIPGKACLVAQVPYTDFAGINALERMGFCATQTSVTLAKDLSRSDSTCPHQGDYEVERVRPDAIDQIMARTGSAIPEGILGWDAKLSQSAASRVHRDWLASYATEHNLLLCQASGRPVGLLAGHVRDDVSGFLGFGVGSIDLVATVPEYRHNGVASRLIADSLEQFRSDGVRLAELVTYSSDSGVVGTCQSHGFVTVQSTLTLVNWRS